MANEMEDKRAIAKLNSENYQTWKFQMKMVLMESDLWSCVEPGEEPPTTTEDLKKYNSRQGKALAKICYW